MMFKVLSGTAAASACLSKSANHGGGRGAVLSSRYAIEVFPIFLEDLRRPSGYVFVIDVMFCFVVAPVCLCVCVVLNMP